MKGGKKLINYEVRRMLFDKEIKQKDLAKELGITEETLSRLLAKELDTERKVEIQATILRMSNPLRRKKRV